MTTLDEEEIVALLAISTKEMGPSAMVCHAAKPKLLGEWGVCLPDEEKHLQNVRMSSVTTFCVGFPC